jgi:hypothetical protein
MNPKTTSSISLKRHGPYLLFQKVSKTPHIFSATCPKRKRLFFGHIRVLKVNPKKFRTVLVNIPT